MSKEVKLTIREKIHNTLLYLTNNEDKPKKEWIKDEILFDIWFFIIGLISVIVSFLLCLLAVYFYMKANEKLAWCVIFIVWSIETSILSFLPLWDQIRHNRGD